MAAKRLILEGFMGSGKTTCGLTLQNEFLIPFADTDKDIETAQGRSISRIFEEEGEAFFRDLETEYLKSLSASDRYSGGVISLGGGMIVRKENRLLLRECGTVVYLKASAGTLKERLLNRRSKRPMISGGDFSEKVELLLSQREEAYLDAADEVVLIDGKEIYQVVNELKKIYNRHVR